MGGVSVDRHSRTSVPGLWAVGEVARTGLHGGDRLASNSLLEAVVTGEAAAADLTGHGWQSGAVGLGPSDAVARRAGSGPADVRLQDVRAALHQACGVLRAEPDLQSAVNRLDVWAHDDAAYVGWLIARAALADPRSIGAHRRVATATAGSAA